MHTVIYALVYAEDEEDALAQAESIFDDLCGESHFPFDYYSTFKETYATARWGELPVATKICGEFGSVKCDFCSERFRCFTGKINSILDEAMGYTKEHFIENIRYIRNDINIKTDDELMDDGQFRHWCYNCGRYAGYTIKLYDQDGEGIRNEEHLKNVLSKWSVLNDGSPRKEYADLNIYAVPADAHY